MGQGSWWDAVCVEPAAPAADPGPGPGPMSGLKTAREGGELPVRPEPMAPALYRSVKLLEAPPADAADGLLFADAMLPEGVRMDRGRTRGEMASSTALALALAFALPLPGAF